MTKLAHLHFTTNEEAAERSCGGWARSPGASTTSGSPALDLVAQARYAQPEEVYRKYGLDPERPILVFTQHSVATEYARAGEQVRPSLAALEEASRRWGCQVILTYPNDDAGGRAIAAELEQVAARETARPCSSTAAWAAPTSTACSTWPPRTSGNSSSGIKETPAFRCPWSTSAAASAAACARRT